MRINKTTDGKCSQAEFCKNGTVVVLDIVDIFRDFYLLCFPSSWLKHIIHLIFKLGDGSNSKNYWTTMIKTTFSKLYAMVLNMWLSEDWKRSKLGVNG